MPRYERGYGSFSSPRRVGKGVSWQHTPPQPTSCQPAAPTHPLIPVLPDLPPCPAVGAPREPVGLSKGCSWFCASLRTSFQKGLEQARAGSVVAVEGQSTLELKEGRWGSGDAFAWLSWQGKHCTSTRQPPSKAAAPGGSWFAQRMGIGGVPSLLTEGF